jgi:hypothetical protein
MRKAIVCPIASLVPVSGLQKEVRIENVRFSQVISMSKHCFTRTKAHPSWRTIAGDAELKNARKLSVENCRSAADTYVKISQTQRVCS